MHEDFSLLVNILSYIFLVDTKNNCTETKTILITLHNDFDLTPSIEISRQGWEFSGCFLVAIARGCTWYLSRSGTVTRELWQI